MINSALSCLTLISRLTTLCQWNMLFKSMSILDTLFCMTRLWFLDMILGILDWLPGRNLIFPGDIEFLCMKSVQPNSPIHLTYPSLKRDHTLQVQHQRVHQQQNQGTWASRQVILLQELGLKSRIVVKPVSSACSLDCIAFHSSTIEIDKGRLSLKASLSWLLILCRVVPLNSSELKNEGIFRHCHLASLLSLSPLLQFFKYLQISVIWSWPWFWPCITSLIGPNYVPPATPENLRQMLDKNFKHFMSKANPEARNEGEEKSNEGLKAVVRVNRTIATGASRLISQQSLEWALLPSWQSCFWPCWAFALISLLCLAVWFELDGWSWESFQAASLKSYAT